MRKLKISKNMILLIIMFIAIMIMGIGYASIESVTGEIEGKVIADAQSGVFITEVEYISDVDANRASSTINNFLGTMLNSTIDLSKTNPESEITYKVTVYNSSEETVPFVGIVYGDEFYDNPNIVYEIKEGFQIGQTIGPNETKEIHITFKYKDTSTVPEDTILKSYLNFKMTAPNRLVQAKNSDSSSNYLTSSIAREKIETIKFEQGREPKYTEDIIERFDASEKQDESIIGYYTDLDNNGLYELTFVSQEIIYANRYSRKLFADLINVTQIQMDNFSTSGVINMGSMFSNIKELKELNLSGFDTRSVTTMERMFFGDSNIIQLDLSSFDTSNISETYGMYQMFAGCASLTKLNLSSFNTSKVKSMSSMFNMCSGLTELDLSNFDTSKVGDMSWMFYGCRGLTELDLSNFDTSKVENMSSMFSMCSGLTELDLSNFDTSKVENMSSMFMGCVKINSIDLSGFSTEKCIMMNKIFYLCEELKKIYVSEYDEEKHTGWTTEIVTNSEYMFFGCYSIVGGNGTTYNSNYTDVTYARIDTEEAPGYFTNIKDKTIETEVTTQP